MNHGRILIVEDEPITRDVMQSLLEDWGYDTMSVSDGFEALDVIGTFRPSLVISNLVMPKMDGIELLRRLKHELSHVSVIILSSQGTVEKAVQAMREGAYDYLEKPIDIQRFQLLVEKALEREDILTRMELVNRDLQELGVFGDLTGKSTPMRRVYSLIEQISPSSASVLIYGESGTGKECVARTIHKMSPRHNETFITLNCAAIPDTLIESELFGHEKGAFTGADHRRAGCFELADRGTLFLDEIVEMKPDMQVKLLRVLEDAKFRRLGGKEYISVDVRILAATNKKIEKALEEGSLREDLYYRLKVFTIELPPLIDRKEDIPLLIARFIKEFNSKHGKEIKSVDNDTMQILLNHSWPGNVRELRNAIERAVIVCNDELIRLNHLPVDLQQNTQQIPSISINIGKTIKEIEKEVILKTLDYMEGNKTKTAKSLGISLKTLYNKL
ncbi:response regulator [Candidatus Poribacteria bacterium]|nr:response regulator [Candidatus Poribacteria bacterium]